MPKKEPTGQQSDQVTFVPSGVASAARMSARDWLQHRQAKLLIAGGAG